MNDDFRMIDYTKKTKKFFEVGKEVNSSIRYP